jgi:hypothetical protein
MTTLRTHQTYTERTRIKAAVRERDGYCCVRCGMTNEEHRKKYRGSPGRRGRSLHVHRKDPGGLYSLEGCETLCYACHAREPRADYSKMDPPPWYRHGIVFHCPADLLALVDAQAEENGRTRTSEIVRTLRLAYQNLGLWPPPGTRPEGGGR